MLKTRDSKIPIHNPTRQDDKACLRLLPSESFSFDMNDGTSLHFRYTQSPKILNPKIPLFTEKFFQRAVQVSMALHIAIMLGLLFFSSHITRQPFHTPSKPPVPVAKIINTLPKPSFADIPKVPRKAKIVTTKTVARPKKIRSRRQKIKKLISISKRNSRALAALNSLGQQSPTLNSQLATEETSIDQNQQTSQAWLENLDTTTVAKTSRKIQYDYQDIKRQAEHKVRGIVRASELVFETSPDGLSQKNMMTTVERHLGPIQQCYERALVKNPNIVGTAKYEWHVTAQGRVSWVKVKASEFTGAAPLHSCIKNLFRKMKFARSYTGKPTLGVISFPFGHL